MTQTKPQFGTIEEYLEYDDGTDTRYELVDGVLVEMGAEKPITTAIAVFLIGYFLQLGIPVSRIGIKHLIAVSSSKVTARDPDLMIHSEASRDAINQTAQSFLSASMPAPMLVIEVVSPGEPGSENYDRDYIEKPREYAARGIPEFWQVDPERAVVIVLSLEHGTYQAQEFRSSDRTVSPTKISDKVDKPDWLYLLRLNSTGVVKCCATLSGFLVTPTFPQFQLTAEQVLKAGL